MSSPTLDERINNILFITEDPTITFEGRPMPAMTTLLHRVCNNDPDRFNEATRLVELFIKQALQVKP